MCNRLCCLCTSGLEPPLSSLAVNVNVTDVLFVASAPPLITIKPVGGLVSGTGFALAAAPPDKFPSSYLWHIHDNNRLYHWSDLYGYMRYQCQYRLLFRLNRIDGADSCAVYNFIIACYAALMGLKNLSSLMSLCISCRGCHSPIYRRGGIKDYRVLKYGVR